MRPPSFDEILFIIKNGWHDLINTDFDQLKYSAVDFAVKVGMVAAMIVLLKLTWILLCKIFGWHKYSRTDSGHTVSRDSERGFLAGFFLILPKIALLAPLTAILFAVADPFLATIKEEKKYVEVKTIVKLRDASGSMGYKFKQSGKSKGEIAMNADLKFLEMRRGKNDRIAFWLFSDDPYPVQEDFIMDEELSYLKAYDAPWEIGGGNLDSWTEEQWQAYSMPSFRYLQVDGQGGTQLSKTMKAVIRLFDDDEEKQKKAPYFKNGGRSVLIVTDAAIADFNAVAADLKELNKRKITPYIIFIDESEGEQNPGQLANIPELLKEVMFIGGKFFPVSDEKAIENAYREIDKLEMGKVEIEKKVFKIPAFHKFIFLTIICLMIAVIVGLSAELLSYP